MKLVSGDLPITYVCNATHERRQSMVDVRCHVIEITSRIYDFMIKLSDKNIYRVLSSLHKYSLIF